MQFVEKKVDFKRSKCQSTKRFGSCLKQKFLVMVKNSDKLQQSAEQSRRDRNLKTNAERRES